MNQHTSLAPLFPGGKPADPAAYETDLVLWFERQAALLRAKQFELLDLNNLIEELEAMAGRDRRELNSRLTLLLAHLLKCQFQPDAISSSWKDTILEQRHDIATLLAQSPSLKRLVEQYSNSAYSRAVERAANQTGLPAFEFPIANPYSVEQLLDSGFMP